MKRTMRFQHCVLFLLLKIGWLLVTASASTQQNTSLVGDPGMSRDGLRVAFEAWNFCNEVGKEALNVGSPRAADCFDYSDSKGVEHKVSQDVNRLGVGNSFPGVSADALKDPDLYAVEKELYLGDLCQVADTPIPWQFWMVMLKNGNFDTKSGLCPQNGRKVGPFPPTGRFPCYGSGCMNQPSLYHQPTQLVLEAGGQFLKGGFNGSYDDVGSTGSSFYEVVWEKKVGEGGWLFTHRLKTSTKYPWLMLYLRADATKGFSGGYHYQSRGMLHSLPESPNFKVKVRVEVKRGGGPKSQFYLVDIGSCWKNDGSQCDGDVATDVTRYCEMIINPETQSWCRPDNLNACPPYHITPADVKIYRNDTLNFPYSAYHYYCSPGNAKHLVPPVDTCDPYSNPQSQEIIQILPHPVWAKYGYPSHKGEGWVGDPKTWELDVGGLSSRLYFYQDPGTPPAKRLWTSIDMGTEIFISDKDEMAEWTIADFDVVYTSPSLSF